MLLYAMASKRPKTATFSEARTLEAIASPLRMELIQAFAHGDRLTVQDMARHVGRPQSSLYYHVRKLTDVGVLVEVERRLKGRRYESVYSVAAERLAFSANESASVQREAMSRLITSMLRQASRDFAAALESDTLGGHEVFQAGRHQRAWLTAADLTQIGALLDRVEKICISRQSGSGTKLYSLISLIVPLKG